MRMQPHGLGIDRHRIGVAGEIGQVAAMQADGHKVASMFQIESIWNNLPPKPARGERPAWSSPQENNAKSAVLSGSMHGRPSPGQRGAIPRAMGWKTAGAVPFCNRTGISAAGQGGGWKKNGLFWRGAARWRRAHFPPAA